MKVSGLDVLAELDPAGARIVDEMRRGSPELVDWLVESLYSRLYQRTRLDRKTRLLISVACAAALGSAQPQVAYQSRLAILQGVPVEDLYEVCFHVAVFAGFASAINAMNTIRSVHEGTQSEQVSGG